MTEEKRCGICKSPIEDPGATMHADGCPNSIELRMMAVLERAAVALESLQRQGVTATTSVITVRLGKEDSGQNIRFREVRLDSVHAMQKSRYQNPHFVPLTVLGDGAKLPDGTYLVRVRMEHQDLDTWDWHDWRKL